MKYLIIVTILCSTLSPVKAESWSEFLSSAIKEKLVKLEVNTVMIAVGFFDSSNEITFFDASASTQLSAAEAGKIHDALKNLEFVEARTFYVADKDYLLVFVDPSEQTCLALHHSPADGSDCFRLVTVRINDEGSAIEVLERAFLTTVSREPNKTTERQVVIRIPGWAKSEIGRSVVGSARKLLEKE